MQDLLDDNKKIIQNQNDLKDLMLKFAKTMADFTSTLESLLIEVQRNHANPPIPTPMHPPVQHPPVYPYPDGNRYTDGTTPWIDKTKVIMTNDNDPISEA